jgi:hypothetical protein
MATQAGKGLYRRQEIQDLIERRSSAWSNGRTDVPE